MFGLGINELIIIMIIVIVLFGATKLPQLGRGLGQAISNFRKGVSELDEKDETTKEDNSEK